MLKTAPELQRASARVCWSRIVHWSALLSSVNNCSRIAMRASALRVTPENNRVIKPCDEVDQPTNRPTSGLQTGTVHWSTLKCIEVHWSQMQWEWYRSAVTQEKSRGITHCNMSINSNSQLLVVRTITCPLQHWASKVLVKFGAGEFVQGPQVHQNPGASYKRAMQKC